VFLLLAEALQWSCCLQWSSQPRTPLNTVHWGLVWLGDLDRLDPWRCYTNSSFPSPIFRHTMSYVFMAKST
jgi:hypothetical protein